MSKCLPLSLDNLKVRELDIDIKIESLIEKEGVDSGASPEWELNYYKLAGSVMNPVIADAAATAEFAR